MKGIGLNTLTKLYRGDEIPRVELVDELNIRKMTIFRVVRYFFKSKGNTIKPPFKGFLIYGPPGTGKTELVKQIAREIYEDLSGEIGVFLVFVDGASIASPKWGEGERTLKQIFNDVTSMIFSKYNTTEAAGNQIKVILLFDDIESFILARGIEAAKEWHYSINSVLFHELDELDPRNVMFFATTNRIDLVDGAIKSRLYPVEIPHVDIESMKPVISRLLENSDLERDTIIQITERVLKRLQNIPNPTIRDAQQYTVIECIESGIWR
jgi:SpoVK/Ycf46/Vps4 family AAA+-type ATPase